MKKRILKMLISVTMLIFMLVSRTFANDDGLLTLEELKAEKGAITIEAYNIGQGFLMEPTLFDKEGQSVGDITVSVLEDKNVGYTGSTSYFSGFEFDDMVEPVFPDYLVDYAGDFDSMGDGDGYLSEFDYSYFSGWCYTVGNWWASWGADSSYPGDVLTDYNTGDEIVLGDVIRWHFTVSGYGADCGFAGNVMAEWMGGNLFIQEDKSDLIFILAAINDYYGNLSSDDVYETALAVAADPLATASEIAEQEAILESYIENTFFEAVTEVEITDCDGENVCFTFVDEGVDTIVIFADYEGDRMNKAKAVTVVTQKTDGENKMFVSVPDEIDLSDGDKIILWNDFASCVPLCEEYVVSDR